ncbi:MAG: tetratricopeptide repeat protein [Pseudomonadota bacterium]
MALVLDDTVDAFMKSLGITLVVASLAACSAVPGVAQSNPEAVVSTDEAVPTQAQPGDVMFQIMLGEIAATRGDVETAVRSYRDAALQSQDADVAERATRIAIEYQQWGAAIEAGRHWAALEPSKRDVHRLLAGVYLRAGDAVGAADTLERVLDLSGQSFESGATSVLAALQQAADPALAVEVAEVLVERHPDSGMGYFVLGQLRADEADWTGALEAYDRSLALMPDFGRAQLARARAQQALGDDEDALDGLQGYVESNPEDAMAHQGLIQLFIATGRREEALAALDQLYENHTDRPLLSYNLGLLALELEALDRATAFFERAVKLEPGRYEAHYFLGRISDYQRDFDAAIAHYDRVTTGSNAFDAALRAAELAGRVEALDAGLERLRTLGTQATPSAQVRIALSESGLYQYHEDYDGARAALDAGLEAFPGDNDLRYARGLLLTRLGDFRGFEREMREILTSEPDNAQALNALGYSLVERNAQLDEAAELIAQAIALEPNDAAIIDSQGWLYFRQGNFSAAREQLERAYGLLEDSEIAAHLIEVYWQLGDEMSARELFGRARAADPDSDVLQSLLERIPDLGDGE